MTNYQELYETLEAKIQAAYTEGVNLLEAEKLAGEFLHAQMLISSHLKSADLDCRMRKSGLKAVRGAVYTDACAKVEKKPTEGQLEHTLNMNPLVTGEQEGLDRAEVGRDELNRLFSVFQAAHVHFRTICKGRFD